MIRIALSLLLLTASLTAAEASARTNILDAANGIRIATGITIQPSGLFDANGADTAAGLCAHENFCTGNVGAILVQANGNVLSLERSGPSDEAEYQRLCAAALAGLAPTRALDERRSLVDAAFGVALVAKTSTVDIAPGITLYVEQQDGQLARCSMVRE